MKQYEGKIFQLSDEMYDTFEFSTENDKMGSYPIIHGLRARFHKITCRKGKPQGDPLYGDIGFCIDAEVFGGCLDGLKFRTMQWCDGHPWHGVDSQTKQS